MWIKIKDLRIDLSKVSEYIKTNDSVRFYYPIFTGECNDEQYYEEVKTDSELEAKGIVKELDKLLNIVEL